MISFTRTAVAEMKARVMRAVDVPGAAALNVATLDQTAFSFGIGCGEKFETLMGSFDGNMAKAMEQLSTGNALLVEYLGRLGHVVLDEAQDLTGVRSDFAAALIRKLRPHTGVSVFADRVQAIYGFTTDIDDNARAQSNFVESFDFAASGFMTKSLKTMHRSREAALRKLFPAVRSAATEGKDAAGRPQAVVDVITHATADAGSDIKELPCADGDLILYRKRASALMAAQWCPTPYRLRLPAYPCAAFPWIACVFSEWTESVIAEAEFTRRFDEVHASLRSGADAQSAWSILRRFAEDRRGNVDVSEIRRLVARPRPPIELCYPDFGAHGPILSTIHASKGREADRVFLMLPRDLEYVSGEGGFRTDPAEEARVFYVGATRSRRELLRGTALTMRGAGRLDASGRRIVEILSLRKLPKVQVGLDGDVDECASVSRDPAFCASDRAALLSQQTLVLLWTESLAKKRQLEVDGISSVIKTADGPEYRYAFSCEGRAIAWSGAGLMRDLWTTGTRMSERLSCGALRPPDDLKHLRMIGLRSSAIPASPEQEGRLREPFATSGFFLVPMIAGFPSVFFPFRR